MLIKEIKNNISILRDNNCYRILKNYNKNSDYSLSDTKGQRYISFACNDYLGLSQNEQIIKTAQQTLQNFGTGTTSARLVTGNNELFNQLEHKLALTYNAPNALIYNSGYAANIGLITVLADERSLIIADKLCHASIIDAIKLSGAKLKRYQHNDFRHCEKILAEYSQKYDRCFILSQTIFSMDGTLTNYKILHNLAQKYNSYLIIDDAHGLGIIKHKYLSDRHIITGSLAKSVASYGGFVVAAQEIIEYLKNKSRTFIFSSSLPYSVIAAASNALDIIIKMSDEERKAPINNAKYFCDLMQIEHTNSQIVPFILGSNEKTLSVAEKLFTNNIIAVAIRAPSVPKNKSRLRLTFATYHTKTQIKKLADILKLH